MSLETILQHKLAALFPEQSAREEAEKTLHTYGAERCEPEQVRVWLAILKLSGTDLTALKRYTLNAKQDYRDVLCWAEYPRQSKHWSLIDERKKQKFIIEDMTEYENWLNGLCPDNIP